MDFPDEPHWVDPNDYYEGLNIARAVRHARSVGNGMLAGLVDPIVWHDEVVLAFEVLCDAPGGDPGLALRAVKAVERRFRTPEKWEVDDEMTNAARFACWATLIAEVAHRNGRYREAVVLTSAALDKLEEAAGGPARLLRLLASEKGGRLAAAATAVYAIRIAALRRADYAAPTDRFIRARTEGVVQAFLASGRNDSRSHAFATQVLFDELEAGNDKHLDELREVSDGTRPGSLRARTTEPLVEMEVNRAAGQIEAARKAADMARVRIEDFGLWRHLAMLERYGFLAFD